MPRPTMFSPEVAIGLWMTLNSFSVSAQRSDFCPSGCKCGPEENPYTYKTEFTIGCSNLNLSEVMEFSGWSKVDALDVSGNMISVLRNRAFKGIIPKRIDLQSNKISLIEPEALVDVAEVTEELILSDNKVVHLPQGLDKMSALKTLKLSGNMKLRLEKGSFRGLTSLETLYLSYCYMDTIPDGTLDDVRGTLRKLFLNFNELKSIPTDLKHLRNLEEVDFDVNPITFVPAHAFEGMNKLKRLTLSRNEFIQPDSIHPLAFVDVASTLEDLDFYHSDIETYPTEALVPLKKLQKLSFNSNNIRTFSPKAFQALDSLTELTLDGNDFSFSREMFGGITDTLTMLSIRHMRLTELPVHELAVLENLQWLDASSNDFTTLPDNFTHGIHAKRYTLSWMKIENISSKAFSGKNGPVHLGLSDNKITSLDFITDPCMYDFVDVTTNPLVCNCHTLNIAANRYVELDAQCALPPEYAKMNVADAAIKARRKCGHKGVKSCPERDRYYEIESRGISTEHSLTLITALLMICYNNVGLIQWPVITM